MRNYFKNHKWYVKSSKLREAEFRWMFYQYKKDLKDYLNIFPNANILEIWCWEWKFAYFCKKIWVKSYVWIDIDDYFFDLCKVNYRNYKFLKTSFQQYLKENVDKYDIIFVSHVFEHLDENERVQMISSIYWWLKKGWLWINYMPNANNFLYASSIRYGDITHKIVYNDNSFSQLVYSTNVPFKIFNKNIYVWSNSILKRFIHLIFRFLTKIYYLWMWQNFPKIYTWQFINILKKE